MKEEEKGGFIGANPSYIFKYSIQTSIGVLSADNAVKPTISLK